MAINGISAGRDLPNEFNVIIEIAADGGEIKYEVDKDTGMLIADRFMTVSMRYPCNYGYVPSTLAEDGDPMDVLVMTPYPMQPGSMVSARPLGLLVMSDEAGKDSKVLAAPIEKVCAEYSDIKSIDQVSQYTLDKISHFFEHYKALEPNKWVKVEGWEGVDVAKAALKASVDRYRQ